jgi:hypothetical protein
MLNKKRVLGHREFGLGGLVMPMPGKMFPERHCGSHPSENLLPEWCSSVFHHNNTPAWCSSVFHHKNTPASNYMQPQKNIHIS